MPFEYPIFPLLKPPWGSRQDPEHPLAYDHGWVFNEGGGTIAVDSGIGKEKRPGQFNSTMLGTVHWVIRRFGWSVLFAGSNDFNIWLPEDDVFHFTDNDWTLEVMVRTPSSFPANSHPIGKGGASTVSPYSIWIDADVFKILIGASGGGSYDSNFTVATGLSTNAEYHWVVTKEGTLVSGYQNGALGATDTLSSATIDNDDFGFRIGAGSNGNAETSDVFPWSGHIHWGRVWTTRALSAGEVKTLYEKPFQMMVHPVEQLFQELGKVPAAAGNIPWFFQNQIINRKRVA